jgi:DNA-binding NtrC family response regulator
VEAIMAMSDQDNPAMLLTMEAARGIDRQETGEPGDPLSKPRGVIGTPVRPEWPGTAPWPPRRTNATRRRVPPDRAPELVGDSAAIRAVLEHARRIAPTDCRVLILGESGTGKGVLARLLHELSPRRTKRFLDVHCGAASKDLESELFGHAPGAFTGAVRHRPSAFELADGGTLCLDEFGEMTPELQSQLLTVLDAGQFRRVGGVRPVRADVRILGATHRHLDELVRAGSLRADLVRRLDVIRLTLPPLRERPEDVPRLVDHFLEQHQRRGLPPKCLTTRALRLLQRYPWPGNVRELANAVERLMILAPEPLIDVEDLPEPLKSGRPPGDQDDLALTLEAVERRHIRRVLESTGGNLTAAARRLGVDRGTLARKRKRWDAGGVPRTP